MKRKRQETEGEGGVLRNEREERGQVRGWGVNRKGTGMEWTEEKGIKTVKEKTLGSWGKLSSQ